MTEIGPQASMVQLYLSRLLRKSSSLATVGTPDKKILLLPITLLSFLEYRCVAGYKGFLGTLADRGDNVWLSKHTEDV